MPFIIVACEADFENSQVKDLSFDKKIKKSNHLILNDSINNLNVSLNQALFFIDSISVGYSFEDRHKMPVENSMTKASLLTLRNNNLDTLKYYLSLILLKRYTFHVDCCGQSYEVRNLPNNNKLGLDTTNNPILYEFFRFSVDDIYNCSIDTLINKPREIITSSIIIRYIKKNKKILKNKKMLEYYNRLPKKYRKW